MSCYVYILDGIIMGDISIVCLLKWQSSTSFIVAGDAWAKEKDDGLPCAKTKSVRVAQLGIAWRRPREKSKRYGCLTYFIGFTGIS